MRLQVASCSPLLWGTYSWDRLYFLARSKCLANRDPFSWLSSESSDCAIRYSRKGDVLLCAVRFPLTMFRLAEPTGYLS